jgi:hypothetical protein
MDQIGLKKSKEFKVLRVTPVLSEAQVLAEAQVVAGLQVMRVVIYMQEVALAGDRKLAVEMPPGGLWSVM